MRRHQKPDEDQSQEQAEQYRRRNYFANTSAESLTLDEARLSLATLQRLQELPRLKKLELRRIDISAADFEALKASLPAVMIDWKPLTDDERTKLEMFLKL